MLICIDARIAFDIIQYQILNKAMKYKESSKSKRRQEKPQSTLRKERKLYKGHPLRTKPNFEGYSKSNVFVAHSFPGDFPPPGAYTLCNLLP